jgi:hypothetical protein
VRFAVSFGPYAVGRRGQKSGAFGQSPELIRARCPLLQVLVRVSPGIFLGRPRHDKCFATRDMALGLVWGQATFRMLRTVPVLQRDQVGNSLNRRRRGVAIGLGGIRRHRRAFDDGILALCLFVVSGLVLLGALAVLLSWVTATVPPRVSQSCTEFDLCAAPAGDGNESLWAKDPMTDRLTMTR